MAHTDSAATEYGEVFTRRWVVETILDLVGYTPDRDLGAMVIVEPSVGSGAFAGPILDRLIESAAQHGRPLETLGAAMRCFDLQPGHVASVRAMVVAKLTTAGCDLEMARLLAVDWIRQDDFLLADIDVTAVDFVVGNPPYIRFDDLESRTISEYRRRWTTMTGRCDIYVGFFERGLSLLAEGGKLGFICADRWMRNAYGAKLRELIGDHYGVETIWQMHDVDAFESEVSAYPAITVIGNHDQNSVALVDANAAFGTEDAREAVAFVRSASSCGGGLTWTGCRVANWFTGTGFWPTGDSQMIALLEHLQQHFPALEDTGSDTKISIGVATGADKAYLVTADADVEPDRLLPLVTANDIRSGRLDRPQRMLINPWDDRGNLIDIRDYPRMENALARHPNVINRFVAKRNPAGWYRTIDKVYPGLAERPKLLLQDMKAKITPVFEPGGYYPHHNLYYIISTGWDLEVLGGLLLSRIAEAFISAYCVKMRGGTLRFQAQYLRKIRVPEPSEIPISVAAELRTAFRTYDRDAATRAAITAYGLADVNHPLNESALALVGRS